MRSSLARRAALHVATVGLLVLGGLFAPAHAQSALSAAALQGIWNPVVGAGAVYEMARGKHGQAREMQIAVVGQEALDGSTGYWLQVLTTEPRSGQAVVAESLFVKDADRTEVRRMLVQQVGRPPLELPVSSMPNRNRLAGEMQDVRRNAERVGTEEITTPAGTFTCEHYRSRDGSADVWVSDKVSPWGLVQMRGRTSLTLIRLVSGATSKITGTPQEIDPSMLRRRSGPPASR